MKTKTKDKKNESEINKKSEVLFKRLQFVLEQTALTYRLSVGDVHNAILKLIDSEIFCSDCIEEIKQ